MFLDDLDETFDFIFSGFLVLGSQFYYLFSSSVLERSCREYMHHR